MSEPNDADVRLAKDLFIFYRERELRAIADYRAEIESRVRAECAKPEQAEAGAKAMRERRYLRFGLPPESGHSINHIDSQNPREEVGVSVWPAVMYEGQLMPILPTYNHYAAVDIEWLMDRPRYEVWGTVVGTGSDGEPLLKIERYAALVQSDKEKENESDK